MKYKNQLLLALVATFFSFNVCAEYTGACKQYADKFAINTLSYMGIIFKGPENGSPVNCINAKTQSVARAACAEGNLIINPANPQYTNDAQDSLAKSTGGVPSLSVNPLGFYYCIPGGSVNKSKAEYCGFDKLMDNGSKWPDSKIFDLDFKFDVKKGFTDGNCLCKRYDEKDERKYKLCINEEDLPSPEEGVCFKAGLAPDDKINEHGRAVFCKCSDGRYKPAETAKKDCAIPEDAPAKVAAVTEQPPTEPTPELKACVANWVKKSESCKAKSLAAIATCNSENEQNKESQDTKKLASAAGEQYTKSKAGSGAQAECFVASVLTSGSMGLMTDLFAKCNADVDSCNSECSAKPDEMDLPCADIIQQTKVPAQIQANENYVMRYSGVIFDNFNDGQRDCKIDAKKGQSDLSKLASGLGKSLEKSVQCMCKLSSSGGDCNAIPTVAACNANPGSPGCGVYGSVAVCTPGNGYDAKLCSCQLNPKEAGCPGGGLSGGLSNFASPSIKNNGIGDGGSPTTIASGLKNSGAYPDLPVGANDDTSSGPQSQLGPAGGGAGVGGGGGGGGGGAGAGGGEPPVAAEGPPAEEKGIGGFFKQAKNFFKDTLSRKKGSSGTAAKRRTDKGFDPYKLRPTRNIANKSGIGSKNQDIWKMSNSCIYAETCPGNMNSFLEAPLKQK